MHDCGFLTIVNPPGERKLPSKSGFPHILRFARNRTILVLRGQSQPRPPPFALRSMKLVIFGLTISSSWGNGHATLWRGLLKAFAARVHQIVFFERDVP